ncbi:MAG: GNAT family N-acetyltransferase, partial [Deltaproteobacteria bacterium]|nr:GNAT family N-acetyltransferase [Deltaproteobacteria bacterium]
AFLKIDVEGFYWDTAPYIETAIREGRCFVIRPDRAIRGCMIIEKRPPDKNFGKDHLAIGSLSVHPDFRNGNMGALLVGFAKAMAREEKKRLYVESFYEFRKTAFYKARGFTETTSKAYNGKPYHVLYVGPGESP